MKRAALFLLLLAAGFLALRLFSNGGRAVPVEPTVVEPGDVEPTPTTEPTTEPTTQPTPPGPTAEPTTPPADPPTQGVVTPEGAFSYLVYAETDAESDPRRFRLSSRASGRSAADPNVVELHDFEGELYDVESEDNAVRLEFTGETARVREVVAGPLDVSYSNRFEVDGIRATIFDGAPVVPLDLTAPSATVDLGREEIESEDAVRLEGEGLQLEGTGFFVDLTAETLRLEQDSRLELAFRDQPATQLVSSGPLVVSRDAERLVARATGGASIDVPGENGGRLDADKIRLFGRQAGETYRLERLEAEGGVTWSAGPQRFHGERLTIRFDEANEPEEATLEGSPVAELELENRARDVDPVEPAPIVRMTVRGEKTLGIRYRETRTEFRVVGPAIVETADGTLRSTGDVLAWEDDDEAAGFRALTGVVLESADGEELLADELEGRFDSEGAGALLFLGRGNVRLERLLEDGSRLLLSSSEGLEVTREGERWRLVEGNDITIVREDSTDSLFARADRVWNAELEGPTFSAEGNVVVRNADGELTGQFLRFDGMNEFSLEGSESAPAMLIGELGTVRGTKLGRLDDTIRATGAVRGDLVGARVGGRLELSAETFTLKEELGASSQRWTVHADDEVEATWTSTDGAETTELSCDVLDGVRVESFGIDAEGERISTGATNEWIAQGVSESIVERSDGNARFQADRLVMRNSESPDGALPAEEEYIEARGAVDFHVEGLDDSQRPFELNGEGHQLTLNGLRGGRLRPLAGETVRMSGGLREDQVPFSLNSSNVVFDATRLDASDVVIELDDFGLTGVRSLGADHTPMVISARSLVATPGYIDLIDNVSAHGFLESGAPWDFSCARIRFELQAERPGVELDSVSTMRASGNVLFRLGSSEDDTLVRPVATARGARLIALAGLRTLRLEGNPAEIVTPAFTATSTSYLEFDPEIAMLIGSGPGAMLPGSEAEGATWSLNYHSSRTFIDQADNAYITALQEPILSDPVSGARMRASWLVLWLDRDVWAEMPERMRGRMQAEDEAPPPIDGEVPETSNIANSYFMGPMMGFLGDLGAGDLVKEMYFEGPIEAELRDAQVARAGAIYLNVLTGRGWLYDATLNVFGWMVGQDFERIVVRAKWMRHDENGGLRANRATVTPCEFEEPHLRIVTGDLRIDPKPNDLFEVKLKDNRIELYDLVTIPLFPISYGSADGYTPLWRTLSFGNSARFGTSASAGIEAPNVLGGDPEKFTSKFSADISYLGSRGLLLDLGLAGEWRDRGWFDMRLGGLPDGGRDRGYIRVPKDERDNLRLWYRMQSRLNFDESTWLEARVSTQTDAGVQSEFFENEFQRYEQADNFLHLRSAKEQWYFDASLKKRFDSFRTTIEELPSAGAYRGLTPILSIGGLDVNHTGRLRAEYLQRREGELGLESPFGLPARFPDGFGEQSVARVQTYQRLETPIRGPFGTQLLPFVEFDFRGWDEDTTGEDAHRGRLAAGGRVSGSFWRRGTSTLTQIGPYVEYSRELEEWSEGNPFVFDARDLAFDGDTLTVGAYGRIASLESETAFELDLSATHLDERTGRPDAWLPGQVFTRLEVAPFGMPVELWHDGTYDLEGETTRYSLSSFAFRPNPDLRFEVGHRRARGVDGERLFEAAVLGGIWRANEKWELEGRHTLSLRSNETLDTSFILRRFGHDIVFEVGTEFREGEGNAIRVSVEPRFGWNGSNIGYVRY